MTVTTEINEINELEHTGASERFASEAKGRTFKSYRAHTQNPQNKALSDFASSGIVCQNGANFPITRTKDGQRIDKEQQIAAALKVIEEGGL